MSGYNSPDNNGSGQDGADPAAMLILAERLVERLSFENPALVPQGEIIHTELGHAAQDGLPANRGRIRFALEAIGTGVPAGSGSLALVQEIARVLDV
ncbi:hypothetical protein IM697_32475 [Streptomyces ferrugineus]|uniref:Uncharacterized protein n=1 Tax=Streptomyces ferrugineus TaxID=1413221 RepID=A0A7M2SG71_9ACTN|nr:hypothetical protein [Streptomyces ferrugineus]QOV34785.1 hypothetical protein IM697_32475 [Streptomyces ferrugineus]